MSISFITLPNVKRKPHRAHRSARRHFRGRERAAVIRAMTAAKLRLNGTFTSLATAATACGSNVSYVRAAIVLLKAENPTMVRRVAVGHIGLLEAARERGKRHANGGGTTPLSDAAVERIVVAIGPERILDAVDKLTSPELPLVAAE